MTNTIVIGSQWGDEGKAKIIDYLAESKDWVIRYCGGANAGHTSEATRNNIDIQFISHLVPAGALHDGVKCAVGNGVVLEPDQFMEEVNELKGYSIDIKERLFISERTQMVMPYHMVLDQAKDEAKGKNKIGTTGRGIGPAYEDKVGRRGIRAVDLLDRNNLISKLKAVEAEKNEQLAKFGKKPINIREIADKYCAFGNEVSENIVKLPYLLDDAVRNNEDLMFEGAQGTILDIDHGSYPYVTSSNNVAGAVCSGAGIGPTKIDEVIGVAKAYLTRVGEGGMPTELGLYEITKKEKRLEKYGEDEFKNLKNSLESKVNSGQANEQEVGQYLRLVGKEFGATTGRPRRCGWFDGVMMKYSVILNGLNKLAVTKLDVLDTLDEIKICTAYNIKGNEIKEFPSTINELDLTKPVYETMPGWKQDITGIRKYDKLPDNARRYLDKIEKIADTPIAIVSVGPKRDQTIMR